MIVRLIVAGCAMIAAASGVLIGGERRLDAVDRERLERAIQVATQRYDEWLGPRAAGAGPEIVLRRVWWWSRASMELESQVAATLARARFSHIADDSETRPLLDGISWHLQSRVVEELFDYAQHQPGHHADEVRLFGDHVRWELPLLVLSRHARDERVGPGVAQAAAAVATLERVVGWPALAGALRVLASDRRASIDQAETRATLESALGVPLDWFVAALEPGSRVNVALQSVVSEVAQCPEGACYRTSISVVREGAPPFGSGSPHPGVPILIDFGGDRRSAVSWSGDDAAHVLRIESASAPSSVTLDPDRLIRFDDHPIDQQWRAELSDRARPIKFLASWVVWLQNAVLTSTILL